MICAKCKVATSDDDKICPHCGSPIKKWASASLVLECVVIVSFVLLSALFFYYQPDFFATDLDPEFQSVSRDVPEQDAPDGGNERPDATPTDIGEPEYEPSAPESLSEAFAEVSAYVSQSPEHFISKDGFLYDAAKESFVTPSDFGGAPDVLFLYVFPRSVSDYAEAGEFGSGGGLSLVAALESDEGVTLYSNGERGFLYRESFNSLIESYGGYHGEIRRLDGLTEEYEQIMAAVLSYGMRGEAAYPRYVAADDSHAVIVLSFKSAPEKLTGYALEYTGRGYSVARANFEESGNYQKAINAALPNLNLSLLPEYDLLALPEMKSDFPSLLENFPGGLDAPPEFVCGAEEFVYVVLDTGAAYLCRPNPNFISYITEAPAPYGLPLPEPEWIASPVGGWSGALSLLRDLRPENPPEFILWQK
jgi:hypothetical protein